MACTAGCAQTFDQIDESRCRGDRAIPDRVADSDQFLFHHPAGTDVHVPDLGIAHLAGRQTDVAARGIQQRVRAGIPKHCEIGGVREANGIVGGFFPPAEPIQDDQHHRPGRLCRHCAFAPTHCP
jgi:hypothetical protein